MNIYGVIFDVDQLKIKIDSLLEKTAVPDFWNDSQNAQKINRQISRLKSVVESWEKLKAQEENLQVLLDLAEESNDKELQEEFKSELREFKVQVEELELKSILGGVDDPKNAILTIHAGAGGTEAQDWVQMLLRMYTRWIERRGFAYHILDLLPGEEAGIKSAVLEVQGDYAYGYLKAEGGVHRLVRLSPFDANHRRHTSFASVFVFPEIESDVDIEINPKDLRIDTFRASGAGGQHVNKTDSAVRITHIPTGIVVQSQAERSQHMNRENALKILRSRLYKKKMEEEEQKRSEIEKGKKDIAWGSQIRSYVFHPYNMVKDHRTGAETGNTQAVMDGDIDRFIRAYLLSHIT
ncbi:peptide chain release factor 2 [bacterium BMS3Bbin03]|nr:peptide chain release factor 2 [bacterium BMS3Bbin03]